jgi:hypothetical protein
MAAEGTSDFLDPETKARVLAAVRYAEHHWAPAEWRDKHLEEATNGEG